MDERPDVLFVILDSLRKDHVSTYGCERETTPTLDAFARHSSVYENAYAPAPWTLPSHCSMFTGLFPSEHGVTNGFTDAVQRLPAEHETVAERLSNRAYRTAGFSNNPWVGKLSGLDRGFDRFVEYDLEISASDGRESSRSELLSAGHSLLGRLTQQPLVLLKRRFFTEQLVSKAIRWCTDTGGPTFTFLNLMEAHSPYYPPDWAFESLGLDTPGPVEPRLLNTKLLAYVMGKRTLSSAEQRRIHEFLDASVRYQDHQVDRLLAALQRDGQLADTLVVVCADHGKTLGEYDRDATPPHYLRSINVNVPLLVNRPGQTTGERIDQPVELTELADFLAGAGRRSLPESKHALVEDFVPHTGAKSEPVTRWRALADGDETYVRDEGGREFLLGGQGTAERAAPVSAVSADKLDVVRRLFSERVDRLDDDGASDTDRSQTDIDAGRQSQLRDLGYL